jgi:DNA-binding GntR family transcriptional regulator
MEGPIARPALYQEVAARLRGLIYRGELAPGARLEEQALARGFGISRTPLREALKVLHAEGLVRLTPRRGAFVAGELTQEDLDALFPVMALLEGRCAYEAARRASAPDLARLGAAHLELERTAAAGDLAAYHERTAAFREAIQEIAANPWLSRAIGDLRKFLRLLRGRELGVPGRLDASLAEHRRLMRALRAHDAPRAERLMRAHLLAQRDALSELDGGPSRRPARAPTDRAHRRARS